LQHAPPDRDAFVRDACGADRSLEQEVSSLLTAHLQEESFFEKPALGIVDRAAAETEAAPDGPALHAGDRFGPYDVVECLGIGGMGQVFKARDPKLNRFIALKLLSSDVADPTARRRFQREAQTASALNHPHILTVHDTGEVAGRQYLVTEFVDGGTLKDWWSAAPRTWREIVELIIGVADGVAAAHDAGILHRDIKPDNILVSRSGYAKLADFGLATLVDARVTDATAAGSAAATRPGMMLGTIAYMSPEQASGQPLDARSDIFSFAIVLYELVAGQRPFTGATDLDLLQAIVCAPAPPLSARVPAGLRLVIEKALEKDPADRYQSMRELVVDLRRLLRQTGEVATLERPRRVSKLAALAVAVAIGALAAGGAALYLRRVEPLPPFRQEYAQLTNFADSVVSPALSPDGRLLTYLRGANTFVGPGEVYVQMLPDGEPVQLTHDGLQKMSPAFSPDGSRIAYTSVVQVGEWNTSIVPVLGGAPRRFLNNASGLTWIGPRGSRSDVLFSAHTGDGIHMAIATAAENDRQHDRRVYAPADVNGMAHRSSLAPDGRSALVVEMGSGWLPCRVVPFDGGGSPQVVGPPGAPCTDAAWSPDGKWIYLSANTGSGFHIWRQRFPGGVPQQLTSGATDEQGIAVAADGRSLVTAIGVDQNTIWIHDANGDRQVTSQGYGYEPQFSSDGGRLYYLLRSGVSTRTWVSGALWVTDLASGQRERLLPDFLIEDYSVSADGSRIAFTDASDSGRGQVWIASLDGSTPPRRLADSQSRSVFGRALFGPDDRIYFIHDHGVYRIDAEGRAPVRVVADPVRTLYGVSPDGRWVAVWTTGTSVVLHSLTGESPIELCPVCGTVGAENRGTTPPIISWSRDGRFVYFHFHFTTRETFAIPLRPGQVVPPVPKGGITAQSVARLPGAVPFPQSQTYAGDSPSVYAYVRNTSQRNIYRVPLP